MGGITTGGEEIGGNTERQEREGEKGWKGLRKLWMEKGSRMESWGSEGKGGEDG